MEANHEEGGRSTGTDDTSTSLPVRDAGSFEHPDLLAWLTDAQRLFAEAEERLEAGRVLSALSSLTAVPPLHRMLVERCSSLLVAADEVGPGAPDEVDAYPGLYL